MPPDKVDAANLLDMLHYAQIVVSLVDGCDFETYERDQKLQLAVGSYMARRDHSRARATAAVEDAGAIHGFTRKQEFSRIRIQ